VLRVHCGNLRRVGRVEMGPKEYTRRIVRGARVTDATSVTPGGAFSVGYSFPTASIEAHGQQGRQASSNEVAARQVERRSADSREGTRRTRPVARLARHRTGPRPTSKRMIKTQRATHGAKVLAAGRTWRPA
jgi:hypothetical protein